MSVPAWFRRWGWLLLWLVPSAFLLVFYALPLGRVLSLSLLLGDSIWDSLGELFSPLVAERLAFTFFQATISTLLTLLTGLPGAFVLARFDFPGKSIFRALSGVPFILPTLVTAAAFNSLLGARGWLNQALMAGFGLDTPPIAFQNTLWAILLAHVFYNTTVVMRIVGDYWARLDPRLEQAARSLGANGWAVFRTVTLPLLTPAIGAAALLAFLFHFTSFGVILVLGGLQFATLEVEIYFQATGLLNLPLAAWLSIVQLICTLLISLVYNGLTGRMERLQPGRLSLADAPRPRSTRQRLLVTGVTLSLSLLLILPLASLALRSITPVQDRLSAADQPLVSLVYYQALLENPRSSLFSTTPLTSLGISLGYAGLTMLLALLLGLPVAWGLAHSPPGNGWMARLSRRLQTSADVLLLLPLGTSAVTLGLGMIITFNAPPLDLRASPLLIPLAHSLVAFPFVVRSLTPAMRSIRPRMRQAAASLGADTWQTVRTIDLPLITRAIGVAASFAFTISLGEFGATALLTRPEFPTAPVAIYRLLGRPGAINFGQAMALSTILMLFCFAGMLLMERWRGSEGERIA